MKNQKEGTTVKVTITFTEEQKRLIPRPGDIIQVVQPYNVDDDPESSPRPKEKPTLAYSYTEVPVKASILTDEMDAVIVNGDFRIPLDRSTLDNKSMSAKKILVFNSEDEAKDAYRSLMNSSIILAKERLDYEQKMYEYLVEALDEMAH